MCLFINRFLLFNFKIIELVVPKTHQELYLEKERTLQREREYHVQVSMNSLKGKVMCWLMLGHRAFATE
jgi:hypothetical protein